MLSIPSFFLNLDFRLLIYHGRKRVVQGGLDGDALFVDDHHARDMLDIRDSSEDLVQVMSDGKLIRGHCKEELQSLWFSKLEFSIQKWTLLIGLHAKVDPRGPMSGGRQKAQGD